MLKSKILITAPSTALTFIRRAASSAATKPSPVTTVAYHAKARLAAASTFDAAFSPIHEPDSESPFGSESMYKYTRKPPAEAWTLDPVAYHSDEFYALEQERIFESGWVPVGVSAEVAEPGMTLIANVAKQPILITRDKSGALHGHQNVCRHRGAKLVKKPGR